MGPLVVSLSAQPVSGLARKNLALLAYLALRSEAPVGRDVLCALFWPDSAAGQARASLRQALSALRRALGDAGAALVTTGEAVHLDPAQHTTDVARFAALIDQDQPDALQEAAELYRGDLLEGLGQISPEFERWQEAERGAFRSRLLSGLLRLADAYADENRIEESIATARRLLSIDPLQEHVHRRLMKALRAQGRHDAALRQFEDLRQVLSRQLGVAPEKPTLDLARDIRNDRNRGPQTDQPAPPAPDDTAPPAEPLALPDRPSIAVLRFQGQPRDSDAALLGEGISDDVTIDLSREPDLLVVSRQSSFHLDETQLSAGEIGRQLGVGFYVSGAVRIMGARLRVTAHLVSCATGHDIWAERYDRDLDDFFTIQSDIARVVAATVAGRIAADIVRQSATQTPADLQSYQLVLRGISEVQIFDAAAYERAIGHFEQAIRRSPDYGRAHGWLAMTMLYRRWNIDASIDLDDVVSMAERAIALDPGDPKGHCALGMCCFIHREYDRAEFCFQSALRANPNDELVLTEYGRFLMYLDRGEEGLRRIREAMRVNPFFPGWFWLIQGRCLHTLGRYEEAIQVFERVSNPPYYVHAYLAACYARTNQPERMARACAALRAARPDFDLTAFRAIFPYRNPQTADRLFASFEGTGLG